MAWRVPNSPLNEKGAKTEYEKVIIQEGYL